MSNIFLSVCLITKNESKFIENCLESIQGIADEIIIVDSNSIDQTTALARNYSSKIYQRPWTDDYADARNYAIKRASGKWILFLDADEHIESPNKLLEGIKNNQSEHLGGFLIERRDVFRHRENNKLSHYSVGIVRLFKNLPGLEFRYKIHEQINAAILDMGLEIQILEGPSIVHHVHGSSDEKLDLKQNYYLQLLNKELTKYPHEPWLSYHKAKTLWFFNKSKEALSIFSSISNDSNAPIDIKASSMNQCAVLHLQEGHYIKAIDHVKASINLIPGQSLAYSIAYNIYYEMNEFDKATDSILKVKTSLNRCSWHHIIPGDLYIPSDDVQYRLGSASLAQGNMDKAKEHFTTGQKMNPKNSDNHYGLAIILAEENDILGAQQSIRTCLKFNPNWRQAKELKQWLSTKIVNDRNIHLPN